MNTPALDALTPEERAALPRVRAVLAEACVAQMGISVGYALRRYATREVAALRILETRTPQ
jgi:hypothetical protein